jgi:transmembrane protein EpsG
MAEKASSTVQSTEGEFKLLNHKKRNNVAVWLVFLCFAFVAAFRYGVGVDFFSYYSNKWALKFKKEQYDDPGFTLLAIISDTLFFGKEGSLTIIAAIITTALFIFTIAKRSENFCMGCLLFVFVGCFTGMFNGVRQFLAAAILFAGYPFVVEKKFWKWTIVVALATSIHFTAILMFFIYFIGNLKCNGRLVTCYFLTAIVLLYLYEPLFNLVGALKQEEINTSSAYMTTRVNALRVIVQCAPLIMFLFINKEKINDDPDCRFLFNVCLFNAALAVAAMNSAYLSRFYIYTSTFQILMYPKLFSKATKENSLILTSFLMVFYFVYWLYGVHIDSSVNHFRWLFPYLFS